MPRKKLNSIWRGNAESPSKPARAGDAHGGSFAPAREEPSLRCLVMQKFVRPGKVKVFFLIIRTYTNIYGNSLIYTRYYDTSLTVRIFPGYTNKI